MYYRRHLPHWIPEQRAVFVTWRLAGSNPPQPTRTSPDKGTFLTHDDEPHVAGSGPVWLRDPRVTGMVVSALRHGEALRQLYRLHTFVVMPNHVHVVWEPLTPMPKIMQWLKGRTGRMANRILGRPGMAFWQDESFDHWIRSAEEFQGLIAYVENNPVKAGLVASPEQWPWSSATASGTDHRLLWSVKPLAKQ